MERIEDLSEYDIEKVILFLKTRKGLIGDDNWEQVYRDAIYELPVDHLTAVVTDCGVEPLDYMDIIPDFYLYNTKGFREFQILDRMESIGACAFSLCSQLEKVIIGSGIQEIHTSAFDECVLLNDVRYNGTMEQFEHIRKGDYWHDDCPFQKVSCKDGDYKIYS